MPLTRCSKNGAAGWKWGSSGACYTGPDGKKKALKQGYAIDKDKFAAEAETDKELMRSIAEEFTVVERMILLNKEKE